MNQLHERTADYVSLSRMTQSEATDHDYQLDFTGYHLKLFVLGLAFLDGVDTGIPELDNPEQQWERLRSNIISQVDGQGGPVEPDPPSNYHLDIMAEIQALSESEAPGLPE